MATRRNFLKLAGLASFTGTRIPEIVARANKSAIVPAREKQTTILFQGDSITDAGRNRGKYYANEPDGLGGGYVRHIVTDLLGRNPQGGYSFYNRGVSGDKVYQLANRWKDDCLNLEPDILSILIGVNDFWHSLADTHSGSAQSFASDFRSLMDRTANGLPTTQLIIGEPFAVAGGEFIDDRWKAFDEYRAATCTIAEDYKAVFLPYHQVFSEALQLAPVEYWCPDGVHPSLAGAYLMKEAWVSGFQQLLRD